MGEKIVMIEAITITDELIVLMVEEELFIENILQFTDLFYKSEKPLFKNFIQHSLFSSFLVESLESEDAKESFLVGSQFVSDNPSFLNLLDKDIRNKALEQHKKLSQLLQ